MSTLVPALRAHKTVRPTAAREVRPARLFGGRTVTGIRADSSEMLGVARLYTTPWGLLKQPDKQYTPRGSTEMGSLHPTSKIVRLGSIAKTCRLHKANRNTFLQRTTRGFQQRADCCANVPFRNAESSHMYE